LSGRRLRYKQQNRITCSLYRDCISGVEYIAHAIIKLEIRKFSTFIKGKKLKVKKQNILLFIRAIALIFAYKKLRLASKKYNEFINFPETSIFLITSRKGCLLFPRLWLAKKFIRILLIISLGSACCLKLF
jgi:hypothetical protein